MGTETMKKTFSFFLIIMMTSGAGWAAEGEVIQGSGAKVFVREHPQTGKPFVSLRGNDFSGQDLFKKFVKREIRPDYRMLDPRNKSGAIPYDGPASDRTKVYVFAATMATLGAAGIVVTAALPASAATAAAGSGTGLYAAAGGTAVALGTAGDIYINKTRVKPGEENYVHEGETVSLSENPKKLSFREVLREVDSQPVSANI